MIQQSCGGLSHWKLAANSTNINDQNLVSPVKPASFSRIPEPELTLCWLVDLQFPSIMSTKSLTSPIEHFLPTITPPLFPRDASSNCHMNPSFHWKTNSRPQVSHLQKGWKIRRDWLFFRLNLQWLPAFSIHIQWKVKPHLLFQIQSTWLITGIEIVRWHYNSWFLNMFQMVIGLQDILEGPQILDSDSFLCFCQTHQK